MRTLLIDDEPLARRELRRLLAPFRWVDIVGEAANLKEGLREVHRLAPALLFLDVHMPGGDGFELLEQLATVPRVIFTTAHDEYAVRAFEVNALDYLLKPIEPERLAKALARLGSTDKPAPTGPGPAPLEQLFVRDGPKCWFVPVKEVRLMRSEGNYVRLFWGDLQPFLSRALVTVEARLDPHRFVRVNRKELVNLGFVAGVEIGLGGRLHLQLRGGPEVEVSRRQARLLKELMSV